MTSENLEARHYRDYLGFGRTGQGGAVDDRVAVFLSIEQELIEPARFRVFVFTAGPR